METTTPTVKLVLPNIVYHGKNYYMLVDGESTWHEIDLQTVKLAINKAGYSKKSSKKGMVSEAEEALLEIKITKVVDEVLEWKKDHSPGVHTVLSKRVLVLHGEPVVNVTITDAENDAVDKLLRDVKQATAIPEIYYHNSKHVFMLKAPDGYWVELTQTDIKTHLVGQGYNPARENADAFLGEIDQLICQVQMDKAIDFAGEVAGWKAGLHQYNGSRFLIKRGVTLVTPCKGDCPDIRQFLETLLTDGQVDYYYGWLRHALGGLYHNNPRYGKAVILTGAPDCGKTLCLELTTEIMGGRGAKPYSSMKGKTEFNEDLSGSEVWFIDDENSSDNNDWARRKFGSCLKMVTADKKLRIHGKGQKAILMPVHVRLMMCTNCEPQNLMIIPPQDDSLKDKILIFACGKARIPQPPVGADTDDWKLMEQVFRGQIPAFVHWLMNEYQLPPGLANTRYGVGNYQAAEVQEELFARSHENALLELILKALKEKTLSTTTVDALLRDTTTGRTYTASIPAWFGNATDLSTELKDSARASATEARSVLNWVGSCGTYLGILAKHHHYGVLFKYYRSTAYRGWGIAQPPREDNTEIVQINWPAKSPKAA